MESYYRAVLDAIPLMVFVVDADVRVQDLNAAAAAVFAGNGAVVLDRRGGEVLHCLHSQDVPEGCGRAPFCRDCVIRNSVRDCLRGQAVTRRRTKVVLLQGEQRSELELLITANPMPAADGARALLILEDISELSVLQGMIPICAKCKSIRDDQDYWHSVEAYLEEHMGVAFTHGLCPQCMKELYPQSE